MVKFLKLNECRYISASKFSLIKQNDSYYILMDSKLPSWKYGFSSVECAERFLNRHNYIKATTEAMPISADDFEFVVDMYDLKNKGRNKWANDDFTLKFDVKDKNDIVVDVITPPTKGKLLKTKKTFNDASNLIDYLEEIQPTELSINCAINIERRQAILAARSTKEITKNLVRVKSSNLWGYAIDIKDRHDKVGDVYIQFKGKNGGPENIYVYYDVPIVVWRKMLSASSKGHAFWVLIRNNYKYAKLTGDRRTKLKNGV